MFCPPCPFTYFSCWIQKMYIAISHPQSPRNISESTLVNEYVVVFKDVYLGQRCLTCKHVCPCESLWPQVFAWSSSLIQLSVNSRTWVPLSGEGQQRSLPGKEPLTATLKPKGHTGSTGKLACCHFYWESWSWLAHLWRSLQKFQHEDKGKREPQGRASVRELVVSRTDGWLLGWSTSSAGRSHFSVATHRWGDLLRRRAVGWEAQGSSSRLLTTGSSTVL